MGKLENLLFKYQLKCEWYCNYRQIKSETRYFAREPGYSEKRGYYAPNRVYVWVCEKMPGLVAVYYMLVPFVKRQYCEWFGHKWVDESYGGPESGCVAGYCERCGHSHHTQLY